MGADWVSTTLGALCDAAGGDIQTGPFGSQLHAHDYLADGPVPVVTTSAVGRRLLRGDNVPRISREKADTLSRHYLQLGDIVFARRGVQAAGLSALVGSANAGWLGGTGIIRLRIPEDAVNAEYLSFVLADRRMYEWIRQHAVGATMPNLNEGVVRRLPVRLPPLPEQRRIAAILGALDNKIELNRKVNRTLEEIAQAIFKSWFIAFDGQDHLVESELGMIPLGWELRRVGEIIELVYGKSLPKQTRVPGPIPVYGSGGIAGSHDSALVDGPGVVVGRKGTVGSVHWVAGSFFPIDTTFFVKVIRDVPLYWVYTRLLLMDIKRLGADSAVPGVNRNAIYAMQWCLPESAALDRFEEVARPLRKRIRAGETESRTLGQLRDSLLPKLISGEVRVPEAEELVEDAV